MVGKVVMECPYIRDGYHEPITQYIPDKPQLLIFMSPRVRSNYGKDTFKFAITKIWEKIPTNMKTHTLL